MGQLASMAMPLTDEPVSDKLIPMRKVETGDLPIQLPAEPDDERFSNSFATVIEPTSNDLAASSIQVLESFEMLIDNSLSSIINYKRGYKGDISDEMASTKTPLDRLIKEEEYHRGLLTNAVAAGSQIIEMAMRQVTPVLVKLSDLSHDELEEMRTAAYKHGRKGNSACVPVYNIFGEYIGDQPVSRVGSLRDEASLAVSFAGRSVPFTPQSRPRSNLGERQRGVLDKLRLLDCRGVDVALKKCSATITDNWGFLNEQNYINVLNGGDSFFKFMCKPCTSCSAEDLRNVQPLINITSFEDEERDNNTPVVDLLDPAQACKYIVLVVKAMYLLPGARHTNLSPALLSSIEYNKACQPGVVKFFESEEPFTIRQSKMIVRFIYTLTLQLRVGEITDPQVLKSYQDIEGVAPVKIIFMERTKRDKSKADATAKVRSVLLFYPVEGGLLLSHITIVLNTSIPGFLAKIVNTFGSQGAAESAETADRTRRFLVSKFGDSRR